MEQFVADTLQARRRYVKMYFLWFHDSQPRKPKQGKITGERNWWWHARWCFRGSGSSHEHDSKRVLFYEVSLVNPRWFVVNFLTKLSIVTHTLMVSLMESKT